MTTSKLKHDIPDAILVWNEAHLSICFLLARFDARTESMLAAKSFCDSLTAHLLGIRRAENSRFNQACNVLLVA